MGQGGSRKWVDLGLQREADFVWPGRNNIGSKDEERCSKPLSMDHDSTQTSEDLCILIDTNYCIKNR